MRSRYAHCLARVSAIRTLTGFMDNSSAIASSLLPSMYLHSNRYLYLALSCGKCCCRSASQGMEAMNTMEQITNQQVHRVDYSLCREVWSNLGIHIINLPRFVLQVCGRASAEPWKVKEGISKFYCIRKRRIFSFRKTAVASVLTSMEQWINKLSNLELGKHCYRKISLRRIFIYRFRRISIYSMC